jgi:hypothetical protein
MNSIYKKLNLQNQFSIKKLNISEISQNLVNL